jgi:hypothetical protein
VCAKTMCNANDWLCIQEKLVLVAKPEDSGCMSEDSG